MTNPNEQEIASLRAWSESAPYWDKYASTIRAMFEPLSDAWVAQAGAAIRPYFPEDRMSFPAQAIIVTARK